MTKKITHNSIQSIWRSGLLAFVLLLSLTGNCQEVGQEFLDNPNINTTATSPNTGVDGSGAFTADNQNKAGWGSGAAAAYSASDAASGACHSEDRMFKLYKKGGALGQFVAQTVTLPAGTYSWSFWTMWAALVNWDNTGDEKPTFTIMTDDDLDGTWTAVQTTITTQPTSIVTWVGQTGTFVNNIEREVKIKFYKYGGVTNDETNLNQLMYVDDVSLTYASAATVSEDDISLADLTIDGTTIAEFNSQASNYDITLSSGTTVVPSVVATATNSNATIVTSDAASIPGTTSIAITAQDGTTTNTVTINFSYPADITVGQEFLVNPNINTTATTPDTGVDGSGNFPVLGGWGSGASGAYAPTSAGNGDCHSEDRMFKLFKKNGADGQYITQTVTLPAGTYNWSFWTKWGATVDYDAGDAKKPTFKIMTDDDANGTWTAVQTTITTQPTTAETWVEQTGTFMNNIEREVKIKFHKNGGVTNAETNLNQLMYIDDVSLTYASAATVSEDDISLADLTIDGTTIAEFNSQASNYDITLSSGTTVVPSVVATATNSNATIVTSDAASIPGTTSIAITAQDGTTTNTVTINFSYPADITVGQEFLVNPNINTTATTPDTGVDGSGNFPVLGGWGSGASGAYAPTSAGNGDCHSEDRMFKLFKKNGADGQYITQTVTLPAGTYNWSFWTKWGATVDYDAGDAKKPTFKIMTDDDANGTWTAVQTTITTQPTSAETWVEQTGTFVNDIERQVKIKFHKDGGVTNAETNLNQLMYIDDVSLQYAGVLGVSDLDIVSFSIYPNPTSGFISIKGIENINSIKVYSILGALEKEVFNTNQIDVSKLASGIHLIKVDNGTVFTRKIIKQ